MISITKNILKLSLLEFYVHKNTKPLSIYQIIETNLQEDFVV